MGYRDFIDFVQRNGQDLAPFDQFVIDDDSKEDNNNDEEDNNSEEEYDSDDDYEEDIQYGCTDAILVKIPKEHKIRDILSWSLTEFSKFETIEDIYDDPEFTECEGYFDAMCENTKGWWNESIWEPTNMPGFYVVVFEKYTYNAFVLGNIKANDIDQRYYNLVFRNRNILVPPTKELCYEKIINAGPENLFEFDKLELKSFSLPKEYIEIRDEILNSFIFKNNHIYMSSVDNSKFKDLQQARLAILVKDHINDDIDTRLEIVTVQKNSSESSFCCKSDVNYIFNLKYYPSENLYVDDKLLNGCVKCGEKRWPGLFTCLEHKNVDHKKLFSKKQKEVNNKYNTLVKMMKEKYMNITIPQCLEVKFIEKNKKYNYILELKKDKKTKSALKVKKVEEEKVIESKKEKLVEKKEVIDKKENKVEYKVEKKVEKKEKKEVEKKVIEKKVENKSLVEIIKIDVDKLKRSEGRGKNKYTATNLKGFIIKISKEKKEKIDTKGTKKEQIKRILKYLE